MWIQLALVATRACGPPWPSCAAREGQAYHRAYVYTSCAAREGQENRDVRHTAREHMHTSATVFLGLLFLLGATVGSSGPRAFSSSAHTQGSEWETLNNEVKSLYQQGQYDRAEVVAQQALEVAEKAVGPNHPDVATSLTNLAVLYDAQSQYVGHTTDRGMSTQAEPLAKRALAIWEKARGPNHPTVEIG